MSVRVIGAADGNMTGPRPALAARQVLAVRRARGSGARARDLALAYGVSIRTIYRYVRYAAFTEVRIGPWAATFALDREGVPHQLTTWTRAA